MANQEIKFMFPGRPVDVCPVRVGLGKPQKLGVKTHTHTQIADLAIFRNNLSHCLHSADKVMLRKGKGLAQGHTAGSDFVLFVSRSNASNLSIHRQTCLPLYVSRV